jgi:hypothetical protein
VYACPAIPEEMTQESMETFLIRAAKAKERRRSRKSFAEAEEAEMCARRISAILGRYGRQASFGIDGCAASQASAASAIAATSSTTSLVDEAQPRPEVAPTTPEADAAQVRIMVAEGEPPLSRMDDAGAGPGGAESAAGGHTGGASVATSQKKKTVRWIAEEARGVGALAATLAAGASPTPPRLMEAEAERSQARAPTPRPALDDVDAGGASCSTNAGSQRVPVPSEVPQQAEISARAAAGPAGSGLSSTSLSSSLAEEPPEPIPEPVERRDGDTIEIAPVEVAELDEAVHVEEFRVRRKSL